MWHVLIVLVIWLTCGILAAGIELARNMSVWKPRMKLDNSEPLFTFRDHATFSYTWGITGGPISLFIAFFSSGCAQYGLMYLKPKDSL